MLKSLIETDAPDRLRRARRLAWPLAALSILFVAVDAILRNFAQGGTVGAIVLVAGVGALAAVGALIASRAANSIGWVFLAGAATFGLSSLASVYGTYAIPRGLPLGMLALSTQWPFFLSLGMFGWIFLLFPTGTLPSRRWRWLSRVYVAALFVIGAGFALLPASVTLHGVNVGRNPLGIEALKSPLSGLLGIAGITLVACQLASLAAPIVRYRRGGHEERQQIRWLAFVGVLAGIAFVVWITLGIESEKDLANHGLALANTLATGFLTAVVGFAIPAATFVAISRYKLYNLDVVVRKTIVAGIVVVVAFVVILLVLAVVPLLVVGARLSGWEKVLLGVGIALGAALIPLTRVARRVADRIVYGHRATPYEVLTAFGGRAGQTYATDEALPQMAKILADGVGATSACVWLRIGERLTPAATFPQDTDRIPVAMSGTELPSVEGESLVQVCHQGELLGALGVVMPANDPFDPAKERLIQDLASQAGLMLRNVRLIEDLRASRQRLVAAQDEERRKIERNIHDGAQQQLVALAVQLRLAESLVGKDPEKEREMLAQLQASTTGALEDLRDLARGIYPPLLADKGLVPALEAQARKVAVATTVEADAVGRYAQEAEAAVYFCCLEALQNVAKYASASRIKLSLSDGKGRLTFVVSDDGVGFDTAVTSYGTGLQGMADRLAALGGAVEVRSQVGEGTTVTGVLPARVAG